VDGISLETLSSPPTTPESPILISGDGFKPAPEMQKQTIVTRTK
jgi:hypothetical protein